MGQIFWERISIFYCKVVLDTEENLFPIQPIEDQPWDEDQAECENKQLSDCLYIHCYKTGVLKYCRSIAFHLERMED